MLATDRYPQRVALVRQLVAAGDLAALGTQLVDLAAHNGDTWRFDGAEVRRAVETLPPPRRHALIIDVIERAGETVAIDSLVRWLAGGLGPDDLSWRAARRLIAAAEACEVAIPEELRVLADVAVRETGDVPPALLAVMRRSAKWMPTRSAPLGPWLSKATAPLNAGEAWAEAANAEAPDPQLLVHALGAKGARPAPGWARTAVGLCGEDGAQLVHRWFALVPRPRTVRLRNHGIYDANEILDPYNALALRGLLFLLAARTPHHPGDPAAIGRLAGHAAEKVPGHGPRSQIVAYAAVYALERIGTGAALDELQRLRGLGPLPGLAGRLDAAIARRRAALGRTA
ncbi:hypothetical protein [Dactylosporangium sp. CA-233914]|uniref:hypothetical protein n=1 Tax=Dactylosporangium sp. CA-233914 TaxID=3239934 RepID=UPI003D92FEC1